MEPTIITVTPKTSIDTALTIYKMLRNRQTLNKNAIWLRNKDITFDPIKVIITITERK